MSDVHLWTGDAKTRLQELPDGVVNAVVTSPPYFAQRRYGGGVQEIGGEPSLDDYITNLVGTFRQVRRVLRDDGSCWIVIGDGYAARREGAIKHKDLIGAPHALALALRADGWYWRHMIVWAKTNELSESVKDRCTTSHEYVLHLTKSPRYYHDWFGIAESLAASSLARMAQSSFSSQTGGDKDYRNGTNANRSARKTLENLAGNGQSVRNARSVWTIAVEPTRIKHTATFPTRLASRIIRAATPDAGCCAKCGTPLRRVLDIGEPDEARMAACGADASGGYRGKSQKDYRSAGAQDASATKARILAGMRKKQTVGWEKVCSCADNRPTVPSLVLDPFSGISTTGLCAARMGERDSIMIDLNDSYHAMAAERLTDPLTKCLDTDGSRLPFCGVGVHR